MGEKPARYVNITASSLLFLDIIMVVFVAKCTFLIIYSVRHFNIFASYYKLKLANVWPKLCSIEGFMALSNGKAALHGDKQPGAAI